MNVRGFARGLLAGSAVCFTIANADHVHAQETEQAIAEAGDDASTDIIVTATRRSERLQDVPLAVTAVTGTELREANINSITQARAISPSLTITTGTNPSSTVNLQIRGIGTTGNSRAFEGAVGVFVDGVYRPKAGQILQDWLDIDGLQVLRGPQGTLFGRNTSAGAILITTGQPDLSGDYGQANARYGNYGTYSASVMGNLALSDQVGMRIAVQASGTDGFLHNTSTSARYNRSRSYSGRIGFLAEPTDGLRLTLSADFSKTTGNCCYGTVLVRQGLFSPIVDRLSLANGFTPSSPNLDRYETSPNRDARQRVEEGGVMLKIEKEVMDGTLQSITSYRRFDFKQTNADADFSGMDLLWLNHSYDLSTFSQEVSFSRRFNWLAGTEVVAGVYYDHGSAASTRRVFWGSQAQAFYDARFPVGTIAAPAGRFFDEDFPATNQSYAGFANATVDITDKFSLILGARLSHESRSGAFIANDPPLNPRNFFSVAGLAPSPQYDQTFSSEAFSGTAGVRYKFSRDAMVYATYSRGFKSGGVNLDRNAAGGAAQLAAPLSPQYASEYVDTYEAGLKLTYFGGRARTNIAAFASDITNLQVAQFSGLQFTVINAPSAKVRGAEIENHFEPIDGLALDFAATWLPTRRYGVFPQIGVISGRDFQQAPDWAASASIKYQIPLSGNVTLTPRASYQYRGAVFTSAANNFRQREVGLLNMDIALSSTDQWSISAFCQNCTDKRYIVEHFNTPLLTNEVRAFVGAPRSYGIVLSHQF